MKICQTGDICISLSRQETATGMQLLNTWICQISVQLFRIQSIQDQHQGTISPFSLKNLLNGRFILAFSVLSLCCEPALHQKFQIGKNKKGQVIYKFKVLLSVPKRILNREELPRKIVVHQVWDKNPFIIHFKYAPSQIFRQRGGELYCRFFFKLNYKRWLQQY